ncbi:MAG: DUF3806 domain-containing protein [Pseudomonadota bacterium]
MRDPQDFAERLKAGFYAVLARNVSENAHDGLVPILILRGGEVNKEEYLAVADAVITLGRAPVPEDVQLDLLPQFLSDFKPTRELQTLIEPLDQSDERFLAERRKLWSVIADRFEDLRGERSEGDALVNLTIQEAIEGPKISQDLAVEVVGVWLGDQFTSEAGYRWVNLTDAFGPCLCMTKEFENGFKSSLAPFSMVRKRLEQGEVFDARRLVDGILENAQRISEK